MTLNYTYVSTTNITVLYLIIDNITFCFLYKLTYRFH